MKIHFIGATVDVTGSMSLIETEEGKILIDSGLYQGVDEIVKRNLIPLPFNPKEIKAIILTHAHLDHSGFIPRLVKLGFRGTIHCTKPTMKLARIIMNDSAHLLENPEHLLNSFYEPEDVSTAVSLFKTHKFHEPFEVLGLKIHLQSAGHILGASSIVISDGDKKLVFSGDLGRSNDPLLNPPEQCPPADIVVMESTYGDRVRTGDYQRELEAFLKKLKHESRVGIVASFAVERAQSLITLVHKYFKENPNEKIRFVIDGPMMSEANKVYKEYAHEFKDADLLQEALSEVEVIDHIGEWNSLAKKMGPLLIITSSGMVTGGRVWRYLENWQHDKNAVLFLPGYQAEATAGRALSEGKRNIHSEEGKKIHWSGEVISSQAFSSHADQNELIKWLSNIPKETQIYLNHGEITSKRGLRIKLMELGYSNVQVAEPQ